jgi:hypothetical protein
MNWQELSLDNMPPWAPVAKVVLGDREGFRLLIHAGEEAGKWEEDRDGPVHIRSILAYSHWFLLEPIPAPVQTAVPEPGRDLNSAQLLALMG